MRKVSVYMLVILLSLPLLAQRTQQRIDVGNEYFESGQYHEAIDVYERILRREDDNRIRREISFKMGESHRYLLDYEEARKWYSISLNLGYEDAEILLHLSEMTLGLEEFDASIDYIQRFLEEQPEDERGQKLLESAQFAKENYDTETIFEVSNEATINNPGQQWGAAFLENVVVVYEEQEKVDQQFDIDVRLRHNNIFYWVWSSRTLKERIVFSSTQPINGDETTGLSDIYQATFNRRERDWDPPQQLKGEINSEFYDGFLSYDEENELAYFMNSGGQTGERATADIYTAQYNPETDTWGTPAIFPINSDEYNIGYPSINEDGTVLYFASDMPGGHGGYDIYKTLKDEEGQWGDPINLGSVINTAFNESYPYIAGDVLYFSSFGHPGFGGFDVFYSVIDEDGNYGNPTNMGVPVNSSADDFGFIIDENYTRGFFSSNRPGGKGEDDLYSFRVVPKTFTVQGQVTDLATGDPVVDLEIYFYDDQNNFFSTHTDEQGYYDLPDLSTDVNYYISAYPTGYLEVSDTLAVKDQLLLSRFEVVTDFEKDFELIPEDYMVAEVDEPEEEPQATEEVVEDVAQVIEEEETEPVEIIEEEPPVAEIVEEEQIQPSETVTDIHEDFDKFTVSNDGLPVIYFDFGKASLRDFAKQQLDTVIMFMEANPEKGVIIHAHTDEVSGYLFNFYLSQQRAQSILRYLERQGIDRARVYPKGHGKSSLVAPNATTQREHQLNRRADFQSIPLNEFNDYLATSSRHSFRYLNSIEKDAHFAQGIEFMVQFMASNVPIHPDFYRKIMRNIPHVDIIYYYDAEDHYHRYLVGSFRDFSSAYTMQRELRTLGYEIYMVAFENGERIPVSQARRLTGEL